jgi:HSP20 family protein
MITQSKDTQTRKTNNTTISSTGDRSGSTSQSGTQVSQRDSGRSVEHTRDGGRQTGTGVQRYGGGSPVLGGVSPFATMRRMAEEMDRLFDQFGFPRTGTALAPRLGSWFDDDLWTGGDGSTLPTLWSPQVETFRRGDKLVVRADIPGVQKDDVHVDVESDVLTISGERRDEQEEDRDGFYRSERSYGRFHRAIPLPEGVDPEQCEASFKDGVLEVTLPAPKQEPRRGKRIQIR